MLGDQPSSTVTEDKPRQRQGFPVRKHQTRCMWPPWSHPFTLAPSLRVVRRVGCPAQPVHIITFLPRMPISTGGPSMCTIFKTSSLPETTLFPEMVIKASHILPRDSLARIQQHNLGNKKMALRSGKRGPRKLVIHSHRCTCTQCVPCCTASPRRGCGVGVGVCVGCGVVPGSRLLLGARCPALSGGQVSLLPHHFCPLSSPAVPEPSEARDVTQASICPSTEHGAHRLACGQHGMAMY